MDVEIRQNLVSPEKYDIKCPFDMIPWGITIHQTGNVNNSSAENEIAYMIRNDNEVSFHFAVDETCAVQGIPLDKNAWHAGDGNGEGNRRTIAIEICRDYSDDLDQYSMAIDNAARLCAKLIIDYNMDKSNIFTHCHWSGKNCPHRILEADAWEEFVDKVYKEIDNIVIVSKDEPIIDAPDIPEDNENYVWSVQIGAFKIKDNADALCQQAKDAGFNAYIFKKYL